MGCSKIVAERSTITGSIGVVTGKFNLAGLYEKLGYSKEVISRGRYAQLFAENKVGGLLEHRLGVCGCVDEVCGWACAVAPLRVEHGATCVCTATSASINNTWCELSHLQPFSEEEEALFDAAAQHAYESFRDKAAESRGMSVEAMQVGGAGSEGRRSGQPRCAVAA